MTIQFTKMQGIGNDYIYVNTNLFPIARPEETARRWSTYHTGIGSDGLVLIEPSEVADFRMRIFNADGSEAKMCGNASRCIGKYVFEKGLTQKQDITLETLSGIKTLHLRVGKQGTVEQVTVDMGAPEILEVAHSLTLYNKVYTGTVVSMGNPHFVLRVEDIGLVDLTSVGPLLEKHPHFPDRTNVEFVELRKDGSARMRVWERGSGITQACGTGACATASALIAHGWAKQDEDIPIEMDGGTLRIRWSSADGHIYMSGGAEFVFEGKIDC